MSSLSPEGVAERYETLCESAVAAYNDGSAREAKAALLQAVALDGTRPEAYLHLSDLLLAEGEPGRAEDYLFLAISSRPEEPELWCELARFYQDRVLPYSARWAARRSLDLAPDQPDVLALLAELDALFPVREVTVYVPAYNAAGYLPRVLQAVLGQSYPIAEVLVIDDGSSDDTIAVAAEYPVRVVCHGENRGLAEARNTALGACRTEFLANLDSDVVPDGHWLERLMLRFDAARLGLESPPRPEPLGGVMGRLDELHSVRLADQWRAIHMGQHYGDAPIDCIPHIYGCNGVFRRDALLRAGGYDTAYRTNGEDCDASERVRAQGYRLAYEPQARCVHLRQDTLESVLRTIWRYHTPYYQHRFGCFDGGELAGVLKKLPENLRRHEADLAIDNERRSFHLLYPTFLGLPWRLLSDLELLAERAPEERREVVEETWAALYLSLFALLAEADEREDLWRMCHEDLAACRPATPSLAELCSWDNVLACIAAGRGENGENPLNDLPHRDQAFLRETLGAVAGMWGRFDPTTFSMFRASAYRLRHEDISASAVRPGGPKVAVLNAPWAEDGRVGVRAGSRWPFTQDPQGRRVPPYVPFPFFLATATAMLRRDGFDAMIIDAVAEGLYTDEFLQRLDGFAPDLVLMEMATASHEIDLDWALRLKERLGDDVEIVAAGPHASALGEALLREAPQVDTIVTGEYETNFLALAQAVRDGTPREAVPGVLLRTHDGEILRTGCKAKLPSLADLPWPERETLPMYNYFDSFANAMPWPNVQMHASRGCPFQCIFCVWPQVLYNGKSYRTRDNDDIVDEMAWLLDRYGFSAVYFDDDTFNINNDRIIDLCEKITARGIKVPLCAMGRADTSSREAFEAMKRAGLVGIKFGVETGDEELMERIRKGLDLDRVRQSVTWCKELGIGTHLTFSFGAPGETWETAEKTIRLAVELDPDTVQFSLMTPFPGTSMFDEAKQNGTLLTTDWKQYDGARYTVVRGEHLTREDLEGLLREAHRRWLLHVAERTAVQCEGSLPADRATVGADELAGLADGFELLQVTTPLDRVADVGGLLAACREKLTAGGLLVVSRSDPDHLPANWDDSRLVGSAARAGLEIAHRMPGFNGELAVVLRGIGSPAAWREVPLWQVQRGAAAR